MQHIGSICKKMMHIFSMYSSFLFIILSLRTEIVNFTCYSTLTECRVIVLFKNGDLTEVRQLFQPAKAKDCHFPR